MKYYQWDLHFTQAIESSHHNCLLLTKWHNSNLNFPFVYWRLAEELVLNA